MMMMDQTSTKITQSDNLSSKPRIVKLLHYRHHQPDRNQIQHSSTVDTRSSTIVIHTTIGLPHRTDSTGNRTESMLTINPDEKSKGRRYSISVEKISRSSLPYLQSYESQAKNSNRKNDSKQQFKSQSLNMKEEKNSKKENQDRITSAPNMVRRQDITHDMIQTGSPSVLKRAGGLSSQMISTKQSREELNKKQQKRPKAAEHCCGCSRLCIFFSIFAAILIATAIAAALVSVLTKPNITTQWTPTPTIYTTENATVSTTANLTTVLTATDTTTALTIVLTTTDTTTASTTTASTSTSTTSTTTTETTTASTSTTTTSSTTTETTTASTSTSTTSTSTTETTTASTSTTTTSSTTTETTTASTSTSTTSTTTTETTTTSTSTSTSTSTTSTTTTETTTTTITYAPTGIYALQLPPCATWNTTGFTVAGNQNGAAGNNLASLSNPVGIFVDNNYTLYICDRDNHRIMKYGVNATTGTVVAGTGTTGTTSTQLNQPKGVAVDQMGGIIVADSLNYRIQRFPLGSTIGTTVAINSSANILGQTRDLHIDVNNAIYVTDSDYSRIVKFYPNNGIGVILAGSNGSGSAANQFQAPYANFIDGNQTLYVADEGNQRVQKWLAGATSGVTVAGITNSSGSSLAQLNQPMSVIVDNNGYMYIADNGNNRIVRWTDNYAAGGTCVVGCTGTTGAASNQLKAPRDLKFDASGNLYVSDQGNNRVQKFMLQLSSNCSASG